jgi:hypothetical protein
MTCLVDNTKGSAFDLEAGDARTHVSSGLRRAHIVKCTHEHQARVVI